MRSQKAWSFVALLFAACASPDVEVVSSLGSDAGAPSSDGSGYSDQGGSSKGTGKAGTSNAPGGGESSSSAGDATGGDTAAGGTTTAGNTGAGGKAAGGSGGTRPSGSSGTGGGGGTGGGAGSAVGKFCSDVTYNGASIPLRLEVGSGATKMVFITESETCTPLVSKPCAPIPLGNVVAIALVDPSKPTTPLATTTARIVAGDTWIFWAGFDGTAPYLDTDNTYTADECKADDFATIANAP